MAYLTDPVVVKKSLSHLGLETAPPALAPARIGESEMRLWEWEEGRQVWDEDEVVSRERRDGDSGDGGIVDAQHLALDRIAVRASGGDCSMGRPQDLDVAARNTAHVSYRSFRKLIEHIGRGAELERQP